MLQGPWRGRLAVLGLTAAPDIFEHHAGYLTAISPAGQVDRLPVAVEDRHANTGRIDLQGRRIEDASRLGDHLLFFGGPAVVAPDGPPVGGPEA